MVGDKLSVLTCVHLMPVQFGLFVRWLESSNYLFVKIQLLSTSFATEYFHTFKTLVTTFILRYVYIVFVIIKHKS